MKIGVGGCSHSSMTYGNPWWHFLKEDFGAEIVSSSSGASGNEKNIEKIRYIFENHPDLDLFIYQITEPARFVVGIHSGLDNIKEYLHDDGGDSSVPYYTFNGFGNEDRILKRYGHNIEFDEFFNDKILFSNYNLNHKVFHTMMSIQYLADLYEKKIIFFSWFIDFQELAKKIGHTKTISKMTILDGCAEDYINQNNIPRLNQNDNHLGSESHKQLFHGYLKPQLEKLYEFK